MSHKIEPQNQRILNSAGIFKDYTDFGSWTKSILHYGISISLRRCAEEASSLKVMCLGVMLTKGRDVMVTIVNLTGCRITNETRFCAAWEGSSSLG